MDLQQIIAESYFYLSRRLDSVDETHADDDPGQQQTERGLPPQHAELVPTARQIQYIVTENKRRNIVRNAGFLRCRSNDAKYSVSEGKSGQVRYGGIRQSSASPRPPCVTVLPQEFSLRLSSPVRVHVSQEYSKTSKVSESVIGGQR